MDFTQVKEAAVKYYGSEDKADAFLAGMVKASMDYNLPEYGFSGFKNLFGENKSELAMDTLSEGAKGFSKGLGTGVANIAANIIGRGIGQIVKSTDRSLLRIKFLKALETAISTNRVLKAADKERVVSYAETIFKHAPNVSTDANVLSSILANAVHGEGIDVRTIEMLTNLENKFGQNNSNPMVR